MQKTFKGRGTSLNPTNRFESLAVEEGDYVQHDPEDSGPSNRTKFYIDPSKSILSSNDSPDVGFTYSINPYRGCEHGCIYCFARPTHEYLGLSAGIDFETKILVKTKAAELLREKLLSKSWKGECITVSGVTDCYQPIERKLEITRQCLKVLNEFKNPFTIITKNHLVTRDIDLLKPMAEINATGVFISVTTLDSKLADVLEPRTSRPEARLKAIERLAREGIPVGAMLAPVIPGLTDHEMPAILKAISSAGATMAGYVPLRLPYVLDDLFIAWLDEHFPDRKDKILNRIREIRGGKLNDSNFGSRMQGQGVYAEQMRSMFELYSKKEKLNARRLHISHEHFRRPEPQMNFDI
jgi:DNA repair photolyase